MAAAVPMSALVTSMPLPFSVIRDATEPTIVTSSPSRIQTVPRPNTMRQWNRDHGRRSSRAGTLVRTTRGGAAAVLIDALRPPRASVSLHERGRHAALGLRARLRHGRLQALSDGGGCRPVCQGVRPG